MIIAGIDPGMQNTGVAVIEKVQRNVRLINYDLIKTSASDPFEIRLKKIYDNLTSFFEQYHPDVFALEEIFYSHNVKVALKLGHARGVILLTAANLGVQVAEYSPREIKLSATGNGNASKQQVQQMVYRLYNLKDKPTQFDVTDAMAIAFCHSQRI